MYDAFPICPSWDPSINKLNIIPSIKKAFFVVFTAHMKYKNVNSTLGLSNLLFIRQANLPQSLFIVCLFCWVPVLSAGISEALSKPLLWKHKPLHDWCLISATWSKLLLQYIKSKVIQKVLVIFMGWLLSGVNKPECSRVLCCWKRKLSIFFFSPSPSFEM